MGLTGIIILALNTEYYSVFNWLALVKAVYVEHNKDTKYVQLGPVVRATISE